jgi:hypothetical protein
MRLKVSGDNRKSHLQEREDSHLNVDRYYPTSSLETTEKSTLARALQVLATFPNPCETTSSGERREVRVLGAHKARVMEQL